MSVITQHFPATLFPIPGENTQRELTPDTRYTTNYMYRHITFLIIFIIEGERLCTVLRGILIFKFHIFKFSYTPLDNLYFDFVAQIINWLKPKIEVQFIQLTGALYYTFEN